MVENGFTVEDAEEDVKHQETESPVQLIQANEAAADSSEGQVRDDEEVVNLVELRPKSDGYNTILQFLQEFFLGVQKWVYRLAWLSIKNV